MTSVFSWQNSIGLCLASFRTPRPNLPVTYLVAQTVKRLPAVWETQVRSLGWEDPLDDPLQYSCLENSMGRGAWWATVHGVTKESDMTE